MKKAIEYYRLDGKNVVECKDVFEWAKWFENNSRFVCQTYLYPYFVSTIFVGIVTEYTPYLFETTIIDMREKKDICIEDWKAATYSWAQKNHAEACRKVSYELIPSLEAV